MGPVPDRGIRLCGAPAGLHPRSVELGRLPRGGRVPFQSFLVLQCACLLLFAGVLASLLVCLFACAQVVGLLAAMQVEALSFLKPAAASASARVRECASTRCPRLARVLFALGSCASASSFLVCRVGPSALAGPPRVPTCQAWNSTTLSHHYPIAARS